MGPGGTFPPAQAQCSSLLEECFEIVQEIKAQDQSRSVASSLRPIYDRLTEIRRELESLVRHILFTFGFTKNLGPNDMIKFSFLGDDTSMEPQRDRSVEL